MKPNHALLALATFATFAISSPAARAVTVTYSGDTTGGPTYNRLVEDLSTKSAVGTAVAYDTFRYTPTAGGVYTFLSTASFDNFTFLYDAPFVPAIPSFHAVIGNDDLGDLTHSGFSFALNAGQAYVFVTTGFSNSDFGRFTNTITGPDVITAVPEPETCALMALGPGALALLRRRRAQ